MLACIHIHASSGCTSKRQNPTYVDLSSSAFAPLRLYILSTDLLEYSIFLLPFPTSRPSNSFIRSSTAQITISVAPKRPPYNSVVRRILFALHERFRYSNASNAIHPSSGNDSYESALEVDFISRTPCIIYPSTITLLLLYFKKTVAVHNIFRFPSILK